jgi:hypothetical protein
MVVHLLDLSLLCPNAFEFKTPTIHWKIHWMMMMIETASERAGGSQMPAPVVQPRTPALLHPAS